MLATEQQSSLSSPTVVGDILDLDSHRPRGDISSKSQHTI